MPYNANTSAKLFRQARGTPKGGESAVATVSRGLIRPDNHNVAFRVDAYGQLVEDSGKIGRTFYEDFTQWDTADQIATLTATGLVRDAAGNLLHHTWTPGGLVLGTVALGTQTIAVATAATGLDVSGDQTDNDGYEVFSHFAGASGAPFVVGNDPKFFFETSLTMANVSGCDTMLIGFRRAEVNKGAYADYLDYAAIGWDAAAAAVTVDTITDLNDGGTPTATTTATTLADGIVLNVRLEVGADGVVTFKHSQGTAALAVNAGAGTFTFDDGDPVIPFVHFLQATAADSGSTVIRKWRTGYV
jgi:hypothetical protein